MDNDKIKKTNTMLIIGVSVCVVIVIGLMGLWPKDNSGSSNNVNTVANANVENANDVNDGNNVDNANNNAQVTYKIDKDKMMQIKTPYCEVDYLKEWSDNLEYEDKEENGLFSQTYYCCIKNKKIEMFTIYFGETSDGVQLGYIIKDGKKVPFRTNINSDIDDSALTKKEKDMLSSMKKGINDIIISVISNENYSKQ